MQAADQSQPAIDSARPPFFTSDEYSSQAHTKSLLFLHTTNLVIEQSLRRCRRSSPCVLSNHRQSSQRCHQQHSDNSFGCRERPPHRARQGVVSRQKSECAPRVPGHASHQERSCASTVMVDKPDSCLSHCSTNCTTSCPLCRCPSLFSPRLVRRIAPLACHRRW